MLLFVSSLSGRAIGALLLYGGALFLVERFIRRIQLMYKVRAKVLRFETAVIGRRPSRFPVFEVLSGPFKGEVGSSNLSFGFALLQIGDEVDAFYNPDKARIVSRKGLQWMVAFFIGFILFILLMASMVGLGPLINWIGSP
jgi:hypothetical protein